MKKTVLLSFALAICMSISAQKIYVKQSGDVEQKAKLQEAQNVDGSSNSTFNYQPTFKPVSNHMPSDWSPP